MADEAYVTDVPDEADHSSVMSGELEKNRNRQTFRLSDRLAVEMQVGPRGLSCEWDPDLPEEVTEAELLNYRRARNEMLTRFSEMTGTRVVVVE